MPIPRFRIRTLMIAVAATTIVLSASGLLGLSLTELSAGTPDAGAGAVYIGLSADIILLLRVYHIWLGRDRTPSGPDDPTEQRPFGLSARRPRLTPWRWSASALILVALLAVLATPLRINQYRYRADFHAKRLRSARSVVYDASNLRSWHHRMKTKYEQAARRPWLPMERDPPAPE